MKKNGFFSYDPTQYSGNEETFCALTDKTKQSQLLLKSRAVSCLDKSYNSLRSFASYYFIICFCFPFLSSFNANAAASSFFWLSPSVTTTTTTGCALANYTFTQSTTVASQSKVPNTANVSITFPAGMNVSTATMAGSYIQIGTTNYAITAADSWSIWNQTISFNMPNACPTIGTSTSFKIVIANVMNGASVSGSASVAVGNTSGGTNSQNNLTNDYPITTTVCPPPPNNDCSGAINVPVNSGQTCVSSVSGGTVQSATASSQANGCSGTADDDVWYSFVATSSAHIIGLSSIQGSTSDLNHSVYAGSCGTIGAPILCSDPNSSTVMGLTIGNTYFVRVYTSTAAAGQTTTFNICITTPPPPPPNDECTGAINVPVNPDITCSSVVSGTVVNAMPSAQANECAGSTADDDVWYSFVATSQAANLSLLNVFGEGATANMYTSVYSGTCGTIGSPIVCSDANSTPMTGLTVGNTYYVRVYTTWGATGTTNAFDVCIRATGPCGTPNTNDFCASPATLVQSPNNYNGTISEIGYTQDEPGNLAQAFYESIENNSWFQFTATQTSHVFNFTSVSGPGCTYGIEARVLEVTKDANGCCTHFTWKSGIWHPYAAEPGTVTATGLTVGETYLLMVDGNGGNNTNNDNQVVCNYTIANWETGVTLGVNYIDFSALILTEGNRIQWKTISEKDNDYFHLERSLDGVNFESIARIDGKGTTASSSYYAYLDAYRLPGLAYYRLKQVDFNGISNYSEILAVNRTFSSTVEVFPNPADESVFIGLKSHDQASEIVLLNLNGVQIKNKMVDFKDDAVVMMDLSGLAKGLYFIQVVSASGEVTVKQFIKK